MDDAWFTGVADELARCLVDARRCADACESYLESLREADDLATQRAVVSALLVPAAVARVLIDLIDHPPELVLSATRLCRDSAETAALQIGSLDGAEAMVVTAALRAAADSCARLLEAT
jgi:hypothetical protein